MACKLYYKGHEFESELAFDDFLIERKPFEPVLGDMVFSNTQAQNLVARKLEDISKESEKIKAKEFIRTATEYTDDGEVIINKPPYIGVNKFLADYRTYTPEDGEKRIIKEFQDVEYWLRRKADWKEGNYTEDEKELFGIVGERGPKITDAKELDKMQKEMKNKWRNQAKAGDAIHNVLQLFFTKDDKGNYLYEMSDSVFKQYCIDNLDADNKDFITPELIEKTIVHARELHKNLKLKFGDNCLFYPEFTVTQKTNTLKQDTLLGIIDLLIIDGEGRAHILDYKTSLHDYDDFDSSKRAGYNYQLATYQRMLSKYGINTSETQLLIAPIQLMNFHKDTENKWTYDDIKIKYTFKNIENFSDYIWETIDGFMAEPFEVDITTEEAISKVSEVMGYWFPDYSEGRLDNEKNTLNWLKKNQYMKKDTNGNYVFNKWGSKEDPIISKDEVDFVKQVTNYFKTQTPKRKRFANRLRSDIKKALKEGIDSVNFSSNIRTVKGELNWLKDTIRPYCNGNWEIAEEANELLSNFGIIMLKTKDNVNVPAQIDFIRVSTKDLSQNYRNYIKDSEYKSRKGLTGTFEPDIQALSKQNNLMMEAAFGNVELMETMLIINQMKGLKNRTIGNIQVVNTLFGNGLSATNEELLYCFNELDRHYSVGINQFKEGNIKLANKIDLVTQKVANIVSGGELVDWAGDYAKYKYIQPCVDVLDQLVQGPNEKDAKIEALQECLDILTARKLPLQQRTTVQLELDKVYKKQSELKRAHIDLYNTIVMAIGELKGLNYRQQLSDHYLWLSDVMKSPKEGLRGNYFDNPGNLESETLNTITKLVTEAYQNTRDEIQKKNVKVRKLVQKLKDEAKFGAFIENTFGNQVDLYKNMYKRTDDGDIVFVDPSTLNGAEREFLEFMLNEMNKDRFPSKTQAQLDAMKNYGDSDYYRVPLCVGSSDSMISENGLMDMLASKLKYLVPKNAWELAKKKAEGIFDDKDNTTINDDTEIMFKMTNMFDVNSERRISTIKKLDADRIPLELNFETLLLKHMFAYSVQRNMDDVFPLIKSSIIHIQTQGAQQNTEFDKDTQYFKDYVNNKIFNKSIVNKENEHWVRKANLVKQAASMFTLAMAPVQMFYQPLQGLWQTISLLIRKPDGKNSFTFQNFIKAYKLVYKDLAHFSDNPTLCSALNELYGLNDMDMNTYVDRISTAKKGIWNMSNFLFKFASRPDYYNRLVIFTSQMMGDGCLEAHSVDKDGNLVYDWTKDRRFSKFAEAVKNGTHNLNNDPEVVKQRALYYAVARQFVNEHTKTPNGDLFELNMNKPMALPRAYTNKEAESMKSIADDIYGYYSHEKKSLIMSTAVGSLWLQFRTYWSGKKNQYLAQGGVKLRGNWEQVVQNGEKYYYQVNDNGVVLYDEPIMTESQLLEKGMKPLVPVMQWKGQWQEGIILTLSDLANNIWREKSFKKGWNAKFNPNVDPFLRKVYKNNLQQLGYDFMMFAVIGSILGALMGDWLDELMKDNAKNKDLAKGLQLAAANIAVMSVKNSFLDFNFFSSIGDPFGQWTPFSIEWGSRVFKNWYNVAIGDEDFWDGVVKTSSGLKQIKPALDAIKPDFWRTEREGGTFNKE